MQNNLHFANKSPFFHIAKNKDIQKVTYKFPKKKSGKKGVVNERFVKKHVGNSSSL